MSSDRSDRFYMLFHAVVVPVIHTLYCTPYKLRKASSSMRRQRLEISSMFTSSMRFNHVIIYINMKLTLQTPRPFFTRTKQHRQSRCQHNICSGRLTSCLISAQQLPRKGWMCKSLSLIQTPGSRHHYASLFFILKIRSVNLITRLTHIQWQHKPGEDYFIKKPES